jgi:hypothetical protein
LEQILLFKKNVKFEDSPSTMVVSLKWKVWAWFIEKEDEEC